MKSEQQFVDKWSTKMGCKTGEEICWCEICVNLSKIRKEIIEEILSSIKKMKG